MTSPPARRCSIRSRRPYLLPLALGLTALSGLMGCERPVPAGEIDARLAALDRPNLVLIVVDTLRADWTTPYGFEQDSDLHPC